MANAAPTTPKRRWLRHQIVQEIKPCACQGWRCLVVLCVDGCVVAVLQLRYQPYDDIIVIVNMRVANICLAYRGGYSRLNKPVHRLRGSVHEVRGNKPDLDPPPYPFDFHSLMAST